MVSGELLTVECCNYSMHYLRQTFVFHFVRVCVCVRVCVFVAFVTESNSSSLGTRIFTEGSF